MIGATDGVRDSVAKFLSEGEISGKEGDILLRTCEKHSGGLGDENVRMVVDVEPNGGGGGDQPDGTDCQFKPGICLKHKTKGINRQSDPRSGGR